jgi:hypothetical protein
MDQRDSAEKTSKFGLDATRKRARRDLDKNSFESSF